MKLKNLICSQCGKLYQGKGRSQYCSRQCLGKHKRKKHRENIKKYFAKWYQEKGKYKHRKQNKKYMEYKKFWELNNKEKISIQGKLRRAIKKGIVIKSKFCKECGKETKLFGHHDNYSEPLKVIWLCSSCHGILHSKLRNENITCQIDKS
jgi:hypothetical protein